jgi:hypothetical protein
MSTWLVLSAELLGPVIMVILNPDFIVLSQLLDIQDCHI